LTRRPASEFCLHDFAPGELLSRVKFLKERGQSRRREMTLEEIRRVLKVCGDTPWRGLPDFRTVVSFMYLLHHNRSARWCIAHNKHSSRQFYEGIGSFAHGSFADYRIS
jgi:hypothetical protein